MTWQAVRGALLGLAVLLACGATGNPASAAAAPPQKAIWGPIAVDGVSQFPIYRDLGVDLLQVAVDWSVIAPQRPANGADPADPAYRWPSELDLAVSEGARTGIAVLALVHRTPTWAQAAGLNPSHPPSDVGDYAQFAEAVARRYPSIEHFMVWGEPNRAWNYALSGSDTGKATRRPGERAGSILPRTSVLLQRQIQAYAQMVDATYARLKAVNPGILVIGGNTTTTGTVEPFNWARYMRLPSGQPPRMDLYGHNPFGTRAPDLAKPQIARGTADMSDLDDFIPWVRRWQSRAGRNPKLRLFVSEFTAPTDAPSFEFNYYVTRPAQARWLRAAWKIARQEDLYGLGWTPLYDLVRDDGAQSRTGLIDAKGVKKPAYRVFRSLR